MQSTPVFSSVFPAGGVLVLFPALGAKAGLLGYVAGLFRRETVGKEGGRIFMTLK